MMLLVCHTSQELLCTSCPCMPLWPPASCKNAAFLPLMIVELHMASAAPGHYLHSLQCSWPAVLCSHRPLLGLEPVSIVTSAEELLWVQRLAMHVKVDGMNGPSSL